MVYQLVSENLKHRPLRTLLSVIAIGIMVTMILTIVGISRGMLNEQAERIRNSGGDIIVKGPGVNAAIGLSTATMSEGVVPYFEKLPHVVAVSPNLIQGIGGVNSVTGVDLARYNRAGGGFTYVAGGPFRTPDDIIIDEFYARQNNKQVGDTVRLFNRDWQVSGIIRSGQLTRIALPLTSLQEYTSNTGKITQAFIKIDRPENIQTVLRGLKGNPGFKDYFIITTEEFASLFNVENVGGLKPFIGVIIGISVVVGFLTVSLTMYTAVLERTREVGILRALGASGRFIFGLLVREALMLALIGTFVGVLLTYVAKFAIMTLVPASIQQVIVPDWYPIAALIAVSGAVLGTMYPAYRAVKQDAIEALSYE